MGMSDAIGYLAAILTTVSFVPQAWMAHKTRTTTGVSAWMYALLCVGVALWLWYGVLLSAGPVIVANAVTLALALYILSMKLRHG